MPMNHESTEENTREWPARAMDQQQEPAIPDDVIWPVGAEKPDKAIPKRSAGAEKVPANGDAKTTKAEAKEGAPTVVAIAEEDALPPVTEQDAQAKRAAKKAPAKKAAKKPDDAEKRPAPATSVETREAPVKRAAAKDTSPGRKA